jgi:hypothetical protein
MAKGDGNEKILKFPSRPITSSSADTGDDNMRTQEEEIAAIIESDIRIELDGDWQNGNVTPNQLTAAIMKSVHTLKLPSPIEISVEWVNGDPNKIQIWLRDN